jgi:hypothetical protein
MEWALLGLAVGVLVGRLWQAARDSELCLDCMASEDRRQRGEVRRG